MMAACARSQRGGFPGGHGITPTKGCPKRQATTTATPVLDISKALHGGLVVSATGDGRRDADCCSALLLGCGCPLGRVTLHTDRYSREGRRPSYSASAVLAESRPRRAPAMATAKARPRASCSNNAPAVPSGRLRRRGPAILTRVPSLMEGAPPGSATTRAAVHAGSAFMSGPASKVSRSRSGFANPPRTSCRPP